MTTATRPARSARAAPPLTLWRLEWLRLVRTHRWMILFGIYAFFGAIGPVTARYLNEIVARFGEGMTIIAPDPRPVDGILQFVSNATQIGLLALVVVAASALTLDAKPELAAFLRTRVTRPRRLILPPYAMTTAAGTAALLLGTAVAWVTTHALIGPLPVVELLVGTLYGALFVAFAVAVVAAVAGFTRGQATTVLGALGVLLLLPIVGIVQPVQPWLPSTLATAVVGMVEGASAGEFLRSASVTVTAVAGLLALAARRFEQREM